LYAAYTTNPSICRTVTAPAQLLPSPPHTPHSSSTRPEFDTPSHPAITRVLFVCRMHRTKAMHQATATRNGYTAQPPRPLRLPRQLEPSPPHTPHASWTKPEPATPSQPKYGRIVCDKGRRQRLDRTILVLTLKWRHQSYVLMSHKELERTKTLNYIYSHEP
jgi:hypothetical protein